MRREKKKKTFKIRVPKKINVNKKFKWKSRIENEKSRFKKIIKDDKGRHAGESMQKAKNWNEVGTQQSAKMSSSIHQYGKENQWRRYT